MRNFKFLLTMPFVAVFLILSIGCSTGEQENQKTLHAVDGFSRYDIYSPFELKASLKSLSQNQKKMIGLLIDASAIMDDLFWKQSFGNPKVFF